MVYVNKVISKPKKSAPAPAEITPRETAEAAVEKETVVEKETEKKPRKKK